MAVTVRTATRTDAPAIAAVHVRSWRIGYRGLLPHSLLAALNIDDRSRRWADWVAGAGPRDRILVAERGGDVVGFCSLCPSRDFDADDSVGEIFAIYVDPRHWRRGVGLALLDRSMTELRDAGFDTATLWVLDSNERGRCFYEASGWRLDGATKRDVVGQEREGDRGVEVIEVRYRRPCDVSPGDRM
jgi:ribosomal protein S18 acetylase RimI-like enzyme